MIVEKLIDIIFAVTSGLFSILPDMSWDVNTSAFDFLRSVIEMICYIIPLGTVKTSVPRACGNFQSFPGAWSLRCRHQKIIGRQG